MFVTADLLIYWLFKFCKFRSTFFLFFFKSTESSFLLFLSFLWLTSVLLNRKGSTHCLTSCIVLFGLLLSPHLLCSLLAATMRRSFGSRGRCGLRVLASCSSEYSYTRTPVRKPWFGSALLLISFLQPCHHDHIITPKFRYPILLQERFFI